MKAISLWQPWALLWVLGPEVGAKDAETRDFTTTHRDWLLVHASKHWTRKEAALLSRGPFRSVVGARQMAFGALIGVVRIAKVLTASGVENIPSPERWFGDFSAGRKLWYPDQRILFDTPVPMRGQQGVWDIPAQELVPFHITGQYTQRTIQGGVGPRPHFVEVAA